MDNNNNNNNNEKEINIQDLLNSYIDVTKRNINTYGKKAQIEKLKEELDELKEAVEDYENNSNDDNIENNKNHVVEEIADVLAIIHIYCQIESINSNDIASIINYKTGRVIRRMSRSEWEIKNKEKLKNLCKIKSIEEFISYIAYNFDFIDFDKNCHYFTCELSKYVKIFDENSNDYDINNILKCDNFNKIINFKDSNGNNIIKYLKYYNM